MKQALERLALYASTMGLNIRVNARGCFSIARLTEATSDPIGVDELAQRIGLVPTPEFVTGELVGAAVLHAEGYEQLADVLLAAFNQAARGKGKERHAKDQPFHEQVMQVGAQHFGTGALLFQAFKKSEESQRLPHERAEAELLGAIVYLAGAIIAERRRHADRTQAANDASVKVAAHG